MTSFVTTQYRGRGKFASYHKRLHRADCRTITPATRAEPWTPEVQVTRYCKVCNPQPNQGG